MTEADALPARSPGGGSGGPCICADRRDSVLVLTLNRPRTRNALDLEMVETLADHLAIADRDDGVRCVVLTGGTEVFASGADIGELARTRPIEMFTAAKDVAWRRIFATEKPVVAAVAGYVLGGGCELAMSADLVVAADNAVLGQPELRLGILPGAGGTQRWSRAVGRFRAAELLLCGETIDAWTAHRAGVVCEVVPRERIVEAAVDRAKVVARFAPLSQRATKAAIRGSESMPIAEAMRFEKAMFAAVLSTDDAAEGISAFREKRRPQFRGR